MPNVRDWDTNHRTLCGEALVASDAPVGTVSPAIDLASFRRLAAPVGSLLKPVPVKDKAHYL
jgi:hypothetical protein